MSARLRLVTVVGARPQFIKAAVVSRLIRGRYGDHVEEYLLHTGQHYDDNMSEIFFQEMAIPAPDVNLGVGSGTHGRMTAEMLAGIEDVLLGRKPDAVMIYGDTNSTLAGALAASKLMIPIAHVEAGLRSRNRAMPEEQNRIVADHLSSFLFCPNLTARDNLDQEGIREGVEVVGDVMYDASLYYREQVRRRPEENGVFRRLRLPRDFFLLTLHRAENTSGAEQLRSIVGALNDYREQEAIFPMHPRTRAALERFGLRLEKHIHVIEPLGYLDMIEIEERCSFVMTDSGGVQKEAYFFGKPCITLREQTEWVETVESGWNVLVGSDREAILNALKGRKKPGNGQLSYGNGDAGSLILDSLLGRAVCGVKNQERGAS